MDRLGLICRSVKENPRCTQRDMAKELSLSLGSVNGLIKKGMECAFLIPGHAEDAAYELTADGEAFLEQYRVDGALIIAAGFGSRFVPLTFEQPKGLLEVFGERMIERQIRQLHEVGVTDITIAVGYLKEKFEYLIDKWNVKLLYNPEYSVKNTLTTIHRASQVLNCRNMYLLSSDNWMRDNMFHTYECGSWYSSVYMEGDTSEWVLSSNKRGRILDTAIGGRDAWVMYGPVFFSKSFSHEFLPILRKYYETPGTEQFYWEHVLMDHLDRLEIYVNRQPENQVYEFENLEELRRFDSRYETRSDNQALELISRVFSVPESEIRDIRCLKSGMTNKSFLFEVQGTHYICRIPGPGTERLINRKEEGAVYEAIADLNLSEQIIHFDSTTGYKIAKYYEGAHNSQADSWEDVMRCMETLHRLHQAKLTVDHKFDMRERIDFYEKLCASHGGTLFEDYDTVSGWMKDLLDQLDQMNRPRILSHVDSVADNFLFLPDGSLRLIDWEYAGMCDPLIDVAMCAIYSYYNEEDADQLLKIYLGRLPLEEERFVFYAYMALGGFLWSLWAVYKSSLGEEFGEYTLIMYRYAKRYYRKIKALVP